LKKNLPIIFLLLLLCLCQAGCDFKWKARARYRILIITGESDHDWRATTQVLRQILEDARFEVKVTEEPAVLETRALNRYSALLLNYSCKTRWSKGQERALLRFVAGGKGLIAIHAANNSFPKWSTYHKMLGMSWRKDKADCRHELHVVRLVDQRHPITRGLNGFQIRDAIGVGFRKAAKIQVLAVTHSQESEGDIPLIFVRRFGRGRVFNTLLGHDVASLLNESFAEVLQRGARWASGGR